MGVLVSASVGVGYAVSGALFCVGALVCASAMVGRSCLFKVKTESDNMGYGRLILEELPAALDIAASPHVFSSKL